jgi:hypothetical protein
MITSNTQSFLHTCPSRVQNCKLFVAIFGLPRLPCKRGNLKAYTCLIGAYEVSSTMKLSPKLDPRQIIANLVLPLP